MRTKRIPVLIGYLMVTLLISVGMGMGDARAAGATVAPNGGQVRFLNGFAIFSTSEVVKLEIANLPATVAR